MSQIRLLSVDFDGTLVRNWAPPPFPAELVEVLNQLRRSGVFLAINTGRTIRLVEEALGLAGFPVRPDFALTSEREVFRWNGSTWEDFGDWNSRCREEHESSSRIAAFCWSRSSNIWLPPLRVSITRRTGFPALSRRPMPRWMKSAG